MTDVVYVEWNESPIYTQGLLGWVTTTIQFLRYVATKRRMPFDEGRLYESMRSELLATPTVAHMASRTCSYAKNVYGVTIKQHIVDIASFEQTSNPDLALCLQDVRDDQDVVLFIINGDKQNNKIIFMYLYKTIRGHVICVIDTQTPPCIMHRTIVVYLTACILSDVNPESVDTMDTYSAAKHIKERRVTIF